jgi:uncharacterized protein (TIGR00251 family)
LILLKQCTDGVVLSVKARAGGRSNAVTGVHAGRLKVSVTQAPEKGKANEAIREVLADAFEVRAADVELIAGATSPEKQFLIRGLSLDQLREKLTRLTATR